MLVICSSTAFAQLITFSIGERTMVGNQYQVEIVATVAAGQTIQFSTIGLQIGYNAAALDFAGLNSGDPILGFPALFPTLLSFQNQDPYGMGTLEAACMPSTPTTVPVAKTGTFSIGKVVFNVLDATAMDNIIFADPEFFAANTIDYCFDANTSLPLGQVANGFWVVNPAPQCIGCLPCVPPAAPVPAVAVVDNTTVTLDWSDVAEIPGYYVKYSNDNWVTTHYDSVTTSGLILTDMASGTYSWAVASHRADLTCMSTWADGANFIVTGGCSTPAIPTQLAAEASIYAAGLTWTGTAQYFVVEYATNANFTNATVVTPNPTTNDVMLLNLLPATPYFWRVKGVNTAQQQVCESIYATGEFTTLCNTPAVPTGMASESITTNSALVRWTPADGVVYYQRYGTTLPLTGEGTLATSPNTLNTLTPGTVYYWQVKAQNANNICASDWTEAQQFQTVPMPPVLTSPADQATCVPTPVTLSWEAVPNAQYYTLSYSIVGQQGTETVTTGIVGTQTIVNLAPNTNYTWKVKSFVGGVGSAFSAERTFTTSIPAPATTLPANQATKVAYLPTLTWTTVANIVDYDLQISTLATFEGATTIESVNPTYTVTTPLANFTTYFWRVRAHGATCSSAWSNVSSFKTLLTLNAPVLTTPANNATNITIQPATIGWNAAQYAEGYDIQIDDNPAFLTPEEFGTGVTTLNFGLTEYNKTFYWRVRSKNLTENVQSDYSAAFSFLTENISAPTLVTPANAAIVPMTPAPTLSWTAVPFVDDYTVIIAVLGTEITQEIVTQSTSIPVPAEILGWNTEYSWFVIASQGDNSSASTERTFTTASIPVPTLVAPAPAEEIDAALPTINFTWNAVAVAGGYDLEVANNADFTTPELIPVTGTSYAHAQFDLGTYYWRVRTVVGSLFSNWSEVRSFTVINASPLVITFDPNTHTVCAGEYVQLTAPVISFGRANASYTYAWTPAQYVNSTSATAPWAINLPNGTTEFTLVVTESGTGRTATATQTVITTTQPSVTLSSTVVRRAIANNVVNLNAQISNFNANYTYTWTDRNNDIIVNPEAYVASTTTGLYRTQVVAHLGNCESSARNMYVFLTARKDTDEDFTINGNAALFIKNPVTLGDVNLTAYFDEESNLEVSFVNVLGQEVAKFSRFGNQIVEETFDISDQPAGMYIVIVKGANGSVSGKIVKN